MFLVEKLAFTLFLLCAVHLTLARFGIGDTEQDWGFVEVRTGAHMFWWLHYTTANISNYAERPLIIWLQGGPGMSSSGYGNFYEIGPLNTKLQPRSGAVTEVYNVLFIDNPVGCGFSYVTDNSLFVKSGVEISIDLYFCLKNFFNTHSEFKNVPVYIFGESYGGKMVVDFAYYYLRKVHEEDDIFDLRGIGLGDAYISPMDYIYAYAPLVKSLGFADKRDVDEIDELIKELQNLFNADQFNESRCKSNEILYAVNKTILKLDVYNFSYKIRPKNGYGEAHWTENLELLEELMNRKVKQHLNITRNWRYFENLAYVALGADLFKPVTDKVEVLLNKTDIKIVVYNGLMDVLVNTAGTLEWMRKLKWPGQSKWEEARRELFTVGEEAEGYVMKVDNLRFYSVFNAGHSVPTDNLAGFNHILKEEVV